MEEQSQSVYSEWHSNWVAESRVNTEDPLKQSLKQTFYSTPSSTQKDIFGPQ